MPALTKLNEQYFSAISKEATQTFAGSYVTQVKNN